MFKHLLTEVVDDIEELRNDIAEMKLPSGTKENPARTCRDIYLGHPQFQDGRNNTIPWSSQDKLMCMAVYTSKIQYDDLFKSD